MGQLALTVLVTWFIVDRVDFGLEELRGIEASSWVPSPVPFLAASLILLVAYFLSAALWGRIVHDLGGPKIAIGESIQLFMIANLGRYLPGKVWQIAGLAALAKSRGIPVTTGTAAAVLGQGIALVAASAIGMGALLTGPEQYRIWGMVGGVAIAALVVLLSIPSIFRALCSVWFRIARTEAPPQLGSVHWLKWLGLYTVNWAMYAFAFWMLSVSLDLGGALVPVASAFAAAYVIGYLMVFAPAGIGPREAALLALLTPHFGVASSGMIAVIARLWTTGVELVPAGLLWSRYVASSGRITTNPRGQGGT